MQSGILKTWLENRGFGFLTNDEGDTFAHVRDFQEATISPKVGQAYRFRTATNPRNGKPMATDIEEATTDDTKQHESDIAWLNLRGTAQMHGELLLSWTALASVIVGLMLLLLI